MTTADDDPIRRLTPAQVPGEVAKLMASVDTLDAAGHTQRTLMEANTVAPQEGTTEQRVGSLVFKPDAKGAWQLTDLYTSDE